jgi:hypothetical protein
MYILFNDKKSKRSHKTVGIKVFLQFLLDEKNPDPSVRSTDPEAQKHMDPTDPDPQPWFTDALA